MPELSPSDEITPVAYRSPGLTEAALRMMRLPWTDWDEVREDVAKIGPGRKWVQNLGAVMLGVSGTALVAAPAIGLSLKSVNGWDWLLPAHVIVGVLSLIMGVALFLIDKDDAARSKRDVQDVLDRMTRIEERFAPGGEETVIEAIAAENSIGQPVGATGPSGPGAAGQSGSDGLTGSSGATVPPGIRIIKARYGIAPNNWLDVTDVLKEAIVDGRAEVIVDNSVMGADPAPDQVKQLSVDYVYGGQRWRERAREGETLSLPTS